MKAIIFPSYNKINYLSDIYSENLLPILNKSVIEYQIELLYFHAVKDIVVFTHDHSHDLKEYLGSGERWGVNINYCAGPMSEKFMQDFFSNQQENVICIPANAIFNLNLTDFMHFFEERTCDLVRYSPEPHHIRKIKTYVDSLYHLRITEPIITRATHLTKLITRLLIQDMSSTKESLNDSTYKIAEYHNDYYYETIHSLHEFWQIQEQILRTEPTNIEPPGWKTGDNIRLGLNTVINPGVKFNGNILVGNNAIIKKNVVLDGTCVIGNNVLIEKGAYIENSIIMSGTYVGARTEIRDSIVLKNKLIDIQGEENKQLDEKFIIGSSQI